MNKEEIRDKLVLALDFHDTATALQWVEKTREHIGVFKIGGQLFTQAGPGFVKEVIHKGGKVFLDLKFHDIPNTVAACAEAAVDMGVSIFNVHASGGKAMMQAAARAAEKHAKEKNQPKPIVLGVTVLTSMDDAVLKSDIGVARSAAEQVLHLAQLAKDSGLDGVVSSPREIQAIRAACPKPFKILTPGIRSIDDPPDDQRRTLTAAEALAAGADYLVLGRTITAHADPIGRLKNLHQGIL